ncbi:dihydroorotase [Flavobacterium sp. xlx-214]|uniref:dihydroorotase n=1 Tax=unclassified Flavobacterium TaxID=196869 RepID=UPI0013D21D4A|nr:MULTISPECIES: dihydroorotase [unclassified Flavobacterium]MBA5791631.1 dihydroorotase [Flavobacterium sp. xlx-221]QMI82876.1 dihydroorotase [Flavobacterium sp. xlx-214]
MNILIKSATIIDSSSEFNQKKVDIKIENGVISEIASEINNSVFEQISFDNLHVSSGWMDASVAFGEPGFEDRETINNGLMVAAKSGFTHIAYQPNTYPVIDNQSLVSFVKTKAQNHATSLHPIGAFTKNQEGADLAEMYDMHNEGAIAFGDYKKNIENANLLKIGLQYAQDFDGMVITYSNDSNIKGKGVVHEGITSTKLGLKGIPPLSEEVVIARNLFLLEYTGGKMHIPTISTQKSVDLIKEAKAKGLNVTCSVAIHNLVLTDDVLVDFDTRFKVNPPIRDTQHQQALIDGVLDGTIDFITSDHCAMDIEHKKMEFDMASNGTIGLESAFGALLTILPLEVVVDKLQAAKNIFLKQKASIKVGEKADLTFFNPTKEWNFTKNDILSKSKNAAFLNHAMKGWVYGIYHNNKLVVK